MHLVEVIQFMVVKVRVLVRSLARLLMKAESIYFAPPGQKSILKREKVTVL